MEEPLETYTAARNNVPAAVTVTVPSSDEPSETRKRTQKLRIAHFNDVYNIGERQREPVGGAARFASALYALGVPQPSVDPATSSPSSSLSSGSPASPLSEGRTTTASVDRDRALETPAMAAAEHRPTVSSLDAISRASSTTTTAAADEAARCGDVPLVLFSGDAFSPSVMSTVTKGKQMPPILNALGVAW